MRKANVTTLASVFVVALVMMGVGMGTMAYFSDTETSTGNTFTSGILSMDPVNFGPVVLTNLKPGDTDEIVIKLTNDGTIDIKYLVMRDEDYTVIKGGDLGDVIEILFIDEYLDGNQIEHLPGATYEGWLWARNVGNNDGQLSLNEFFEGFPPGIPGGNDYWDVVTLSLNWGADELAVGHTYKMILPLEFMESGIPQDDYQDSSISFDFVVMGTHVDKELIDGYVTPP